MRVVFAPDKFAGTLTAVEAAAAMARGWARRAPDDGLVQVPMSDGGPGFVDVLHTALGGDLLAVTVPGPYGDPTPAAVLVVGRTAYVESAQAVGLHLTPEQDRAPERGTTRGLGVLLEQGAGHRRRPDRRRVSEAQRRTTAVRACWHALGATAEGGDLDAGPAGLADLTAVDLGSVGEQFDGVDLVMATDVDNPLLGINGATKIYGPQKGLPEERLVTVDGWLQHFAELTDRKVASQKGAGAAGGLGFALMLLGATRTPGVTLVSEAVGLADHLAEADLAVTGEGAFDFSSRSGKVPYGVAEVATAKLVPCIALAGQVLIGSREMRALGVESAYSMVDLVGEERALGAPAEALEALAERTARTWSR